MFVDNWKDKEDNLEESIEESTEESIEEESTEESIEEESIEESTEEEYTEEESIEEYTEEESIEEESYIDDIDEYETNNSSNEDTNSENEIDKSNNETETNVDYTKRGKYIIIAMFICIVLLFIAITGLKQKNNKEDTKEVFDISDTTSEQVTEEVTEEITTEEITVEVSTDEILTKEEVTSEEITEISTEEELDATSIKKELNVGSSVFEIIEETGYNMLYSEDKVDFKNVDVQLTVSDSGFKARKGEDFNSEDPWLALYNDYETNKDTTKVTQPTLGSVVVNDIEYNCIYNSKVQGLNIVTTIYCDIRKEGNLVDNLIKIEVISYIANDSDIEETEFNNITDEDFATMSSNHCYTNSMFILEHLK